MDKFKNIPTFKTEEEEREFWSAHDSTEYVEWSKGESAIFPKLKPTTKTMSLRMPEYMLEELRTIANKRDVPPQAPMLIIKC